MKNAGSERGLTPREQGWRERYGPWAVVTGASDGIGKEIATQLAARGLNLVLVARRSEVLEALATELADRHSIEARLISVDLANTESADRVLAETQDLEVGLLVAAAGFGTSGSFLEADLAKELKMVDVNCRALLVMSLQFGRRLACRGKGGMVLMSSLVAFQGVPRAANYAATKAYVQSLAEALHLELAPFGVDVLASAPGPVHSGFAARANLQMGMALNPEDVAQATLEALGHGMTVRPGWLSKFLEYSLAMLPRWGRVRVMSLVMGGMTKHQDGNTNTEAQRPSRGVR